MRYIVHWGSAEEAQRSRVYLGQGGTMVLVIDEAVIYFTYREALLDARKYSEPPHCAAARIRPEFTICKIG